MGNLGRYVCVAIPFLLTLASLVAILVAGLAGVADKSLYMFRVNTTNLQLSPASINNLINARSPQSGIFHDPALIGGSSDDSAGTPGAAADKTTTSSTTSTTSTKTSNITAADLGLGNFYDITLWGWCFTAQNGTRTCTQPQFNWAEKELNTTTGNLKHLANQAGQNITLPKEITDAISTFGTVTRWTEIVFIIAVVTLGIELLFGVFANCSRAFSCITYLVAGVATVAVCTFASLATAMSVVVVGAVEASAKFYGVKADFNTKYLAIVWIAGAFAIAAGFFWLFTVCCCAPDHSSRRSSRKRRGDDAGEKMLPVGAYQPITEDNGYHGGYNNRTSVPQYAYPQQHTPRRDLAYEPYLQR